MFFLQNDSSRGVRIKVTPNRVLCHFSQFFEGFRLREYGVTNRSGFEATFGRFPNLKNDFTAHIRIVPDRLGRSDGLDSSLSCNICPFDFVKQKTRAQPICIRIR